MEVERTAPAFLNSNRDDSVAQRKQSHGDRKKHTFSQMFYNQYLTHYVERRKLLSKKEWIRQMVRR